MLFSVQDTRAGIFQAPWVAQNEEVAVRMLTDTLVGSAETLLRLHPEDFKLWSLGGFEEESGFIFAEPEVVVSVEELIRRLNAAKGKAYEQMDIERELEHAK